MVSALFRTSCTLGNLSKKKRNNSSLNWVPEKPSYLEMLIFAPLFCPPTPEQRRHAHVQNMLKPQRSPELHTVEHRYGVRLYGSIVQFVQPLAHFKGIVSRDFGCLQMI